MIRRVNYTERKRVPVSSIQMEIFNGTPRTFKAEFDINEINKRRFPTQAKVVLDATCAGSEIVQRFSFGNVERIVPEQELILDKLTGENIRFTLKIIDFSKEIGKILGIAENIRPINAAKKTSENRQSILPIEPRDLGEQLWRLEFREYEVFLLVNKTIPGLLERFGNDLTLGGLVYPSIIRDIFWRACIYEKYEDEQGGWKTNWVQFAKKLNPDKPPDDEDISTWIESVIDSFCEKHHFKQSYSTYVRENS